MQRFETSFPSAKAHVLLTTNYSHFYCLQKTFLSGLLESILIRKHKNPIIGCKRPASWFRSWPSCRPPWASQNAGLHQDVPAFLGLIGSCFNELGKREKWFYPNLLSLCCECSVFGGLILCPCQLPSHSSCVQLWFTLFFAPMLPPGIPLWSLSCYSF